MLTGLNCEKVCYESTSNKLLPEFRAPVTLETTESEIRILTAETLEYIEPNDYASLRY